jgi:hypothetical protein
MSRNGGNQQAKNQAAQMKSTTEMYRGIADLRGVPYEMETQIKFEGSGLLANMMNKMGVRSRTTSLPCPPVTRP